MNIRFYTSIEQSRKLAEFLPLKSADMYYMETSCNSYTVGVLQRMERDMLLKQAEYYKMSPCWSLAALLKLIPKHILRNDKIHSGQAFIPSFRWEISPTAIYYTNGNKIMDYVSFKYGENNIELIDAVFKMVVWLKKNNRL